MILDSCRTCYEQNVILVNVQCQPLLLVFGYIYIFYGTYGSLIIIKYTEKHAFSTAISYVYWKLLPI